jgi:HK97 family phage major capsid protein
MDLLEMTRQRSKLVADGRGILKRAEADKRSLSADERAQIDRIVSEADAIGARITERHRLNALLYAEAGDPDHDPLPHQLAGNRGRYSVGRALRRLIQGPREALDGLEGEVSQELATRHGKRLRGGCGVFLPWDAPVNSRSLNTTSGAGSLFTLVGRPIVDVLRAKSLVGILGARILPDLRGGRFAYPKKTGTVTTQWIAEAATPTESNAAFATSIVFSPNTCAARTDVTHRMSVSIPDAEDVIAEDLTSALAVEVDRAACNGVGSGGIPLGIAQNPGVPVVAFGDNGGAPTWPLICSMRRTLARSNADVGALGLLTTPNAEYALRTTEKATGSGRFIWGDDNLVCGMPAYATNQLSSVNAKGSGTGLSSGIMGNWNDAMMGFWGPIEVIINPFTQSTDGVIRISAFVDYDFQLRHFESFCNFADMVTS